MPQPLYPIKKSSWYTLNRRLGGPQSGYFGEEKNFLLLPKIETKTFQPTDWSKYKLSCPGYGTKSDKKYNSATKKTQSNFDPKLKKWFSIPLQHRPSTCGVTGAQGTQSVSLWYKNKSCKHKHKYCSSKKVDTSEKMQILKITGGRALLYSLKVNEPRCLGF
jgi:hypothetical protein